MAGKFSGLADLTALKHAHSSATSWDGEKGIADFISNILPRWKEGMNPVTWGPSWSLGPGPPPQCGEGRRDGRL